MPRTTVDIDSPILKEIKAIQKGERRSLGRIVSELLAEALAVRRKGRKQPKLKWVSRPMHARVDLDDKEALQSILDRDD